MNPDDAFERILESLYEAALDDARWPAASALVEESVGASGNALIVGEGYDDDLRIYFARYLPAFAILRRGDGLLDRDDALDAVRPADRSRLRRLLGRALPGWWDAA